MGTLGEEIADFKSHRRFTLRCLSQKITPNSLKFKSNIRTLWGKKILQRAEKQLANECVKSINNTIDACTFLRDTCMNEFKDHINNNLFEECSEFINWVREGRHQTTLKRHLSKFNWLYQQTRDGHSNISGSCSKNNHTCTLALTTVVTTAAETTTITATATVETATAETTTTVTTMQLDKWVKNLWGSPLPRPKFHCWPMDLTLQ